MDEIERKSIEGYEGIYDIGNDGSIHRLIPRNRFTPQTPLRHQIDGTGYHRVTLTDAHGKTRTFAVSRLVALAFIGPLPEGHEVNHKDRDKDNNHVSNLEYVTHSRNIQHSWEVGDRRITVARGVDSGNAKLDDQKVKEIRNLHTVDPQTYSQRALAERYGVSHVAIGCILRGTTWTHVK